MHRHMYIVPLARSITHDGTLHHDGRDGVLENQLFLIAGFQHQAVLVETADTPRKLHAAEEVDGNDQLFLARIIKERILNVLSGLVHDDPRAPQCRRPEGVAGRQLRDAGANFNVRPAGVERFQTTAE